MAILDLDWNAFRGVFRWNQGEHLAAIAPTGAGKTTLLRKLTPYRKFNLVFGTKIADKQYDMLVGQGFRRVESMAEIKPWDNNVLLWPKFKKTIPELVQRQRETFRDALDVVVKQRSWTLWVDEAKYVSEFLKLRTELVFCLEQLRSIDATIICGAQRPAWIPPSTLSNSTHIFLWKTTNRDDARVLSDVGGIDADEVKTAARNLGEHEFLYIRSRGTEAQIIRTEVKE